MLEKGLPLMELWARKIKMKQKEGCGRGDQVKLLAAAGVLQGP